MSSNGVAESAFRFYTMSNPCGDVVGSVGLLAGSLKLVQTGYIGDIPDREHG